ncbi:MAG TPA: efflux RND transporter periplasmic adaptor subunit [Candidatus Acidoferrales bacterium]|nr:efflux RND transporter periplasmic adaptor subunit [Candidatus Acidoferrales bacterium]
MLRMHHTFYLACTLGIVLTACAKKDPPPMERPPAAVTVASAVSQDVPLYLDEVGHTVAREAVTVQPEVSGRITEIHFADGANLKKGDLLFTIDPRPFEAQLNAAQANLAQSKAALDFAQVQFARVKDLIESRAIARQDYDTRKNAVDVGQAQVKQNEAAVESARLNLEYTSIKSPIDGRAGHRLVDNGNVVTANTTQLLSIERLDPIYADFTATESDLSEVQRELAKHPLKAEVRLPDQQKPEVGSLTFVDNSVQSSSGTVMLRATVPNPARHLWPGQFVNVRLVLANLQKAVLVPAAATQDSAKGPFVYVVKADSTAELRPVKLGQRQGEMVVVQQGLQAGEQVVMNGQLGVMPGGKVRVVTNAPATAPAGQL